MNAQQIELVQSSFAEVRLIARSTAEQFFIRLFKLDPSLRALFPSDLVQHGQALILILGSAIDGLNRLDTLVPTLQKLGVDQATYGMRDEHYATVGSALLWSLEQGLADKFTPAIRSAWTNAYGLVAIVMQTGAREAQAGYAE
jgi:hemoglobin-like flavoprotein